jgi:hypothetical protein
MHDTATINSTTTPIAYMTIIKFAGGSVPPIALMQMLKIQNTAAIPSATRSNVSKHSKIPMIDMWCLLPYR